MCIWESFLDLCCSLWVLGMVIGLLVSQELAAVLVAASNVPDVWISSYSVNKRRYEKQKNSFHTLLC